jgi:dCMP deaminase
MANKKALDRVLMNTAEQFASLSNCARLKVGAVVAKDGRILSSGFNGTPTGVDNCCETEDNVTKPTVVHAELNTLLFLARHGISGEGSTLYVTHSPCPQCCNAIIQVGVNRVVFKEYFRDTSGLELLKSSGINVELIGE